MQLIILLPYKLLGTKRYTKIHAFRCTWDIWFKTMQETVYNWSHQEVHQGTLVGHRWSELMLEQMKEMVRG